MALTKPAALTDDFHGLDMTGLHTSSNRGLNWNTVVSQIWSLFHRASLLGLTACFKWGQLVDFYYPLKK